MSKLSPMKNQRSASSILQAQHDMKATLRQQDKREAKKTLKQKRKEKQSKRFEGLGRVNERLK